MIKKWDNGYILQIFLASPSPTPLSYQGFERVKFSFFLFPFPFFLLLYFWTGSTNSLMRGLEPFFFIYIYIEKFNSTMREE